MGLPALGLQRGADGGLKEDDGMLRMLNLAAGLAGLALLVVGLAGGLGALMGFGYFGEYLVHRYPWLGPFWMSIVVVWATGWLGGLAMLALRFTHLVRCVRSRSAEGWALSDVPLALGHACAMAAPASILLPVPWNDAFYFG